MTCLIAERYTEPAGLTLGKNRLRRFFEAPLYSVFVASRTGGDHLGITQKRPADPLPKLPTGDMLVRLRDGQFNLRLSFPELVDKNTHPLDLSLETTWEIVEPRLFLREYALPRLAAQDSISLQALEAFLANRLSDWVRDEIRSESFQSLKIDNVNALRWWHEMLPRWVDLKWAGLVSVDSASYESPLAERMMECTRQKELLEAEKEAMRRRKLEDLEAEREALGYQQALDTLKAEVSLGAHQQQAQEELARLAHQAAVITAKEQSTIAKLEAEKRRAEIELEIAKIRSDHAGAEALTKANAEAAALAAETLEKLKTAQAEIADTTEILKNAAAEGIEDVKRVADHAAGLSASTLAIAGEASPREMLLALAREKSAASGGEVRLIKHDLVSRDIGSHRVDSLHIGQSVDFTLQSTRAGYVSILNIGTSGTTYLLTPNGVVAPEAAKTGAPAMVRFPGAPYFPVPNLWENGPPGWEDMLVIISDSPLFAPADLACASTHAPEVVLSAAMLETLLGRLQALTPESWSAGLLGFRVLL